MKKLAVALFILGLMLCIHTQAMAVDGSTWEQIIVPDEWGFTLTLVPAIEDNTERIQPAASWKFVSFNDASAFITMIRPYNRPGIGIDGGKGTGNIRGGVGWLPGDGVQNFMVYTRAVVSF